jgi:uncharacterized small protein (DUF1192 family)
VKQFLRRVKNILRRLWSPLRPIVYRLKVMARFIVHPRDFLALYENEALVTDAAVAYSVQRIENELQDTVHALREEIEQLRAELRARD